MSRIQKPTAQRKKGRSVDIGLPFPNFALGKTEIPTVCKCVFDGTNFFVTNHLDMHTLHYNGSFGTSSLTFRGLSYDDPSFMNRAYYQKQNAKAKSSETFMFTNGVTSGLNGGSNTKFVKAGVGKRIRVDVESSKHGPELCVHISKERGFSPSASGTRLPDDTFSGERRRNDSEMSVDEELDCVSSESPHVKLSDNLNSTCIPSVQSIGSQSLEEEKLILMPEEAIFLSFGVGCLAIYNLQGHPLDYKDCWKNLAYLNPDFPTQYAVYHYFRGKNWVPKKGDNFGGSFVLYEGGPEVNHSTYIVHIIKPGKPKPTWLELTAWQRIATHVSKHVLVCEVSVPNDFQPETSEPCSVFGMTLNEITLTRWLPRDSNVS